MPLLLTVMDCVVAPVFHKKVAPGFPAFSVTELPEQMVVSFPKLTLGWA
jgi:hypothetical protein